MRNAKSVVHKILPTTEIARHINALRLLGKKIVFTDGAFDILHEGHIALLSEAASLGDILIVGVISDAAVKRSKGDSHPVNNENARALLLASLVVTDTIILFEEDTPLNLIKSIMPDVLVKGGDYTVEQIAGAKEVIANGGEVKIVPLIEGVSTTAIIAKMAAL